MSHFYEIALVEDSTLEHVRAALGASFPRILGYFREDGMRAIIAIEHGMATGQAAALVGPAHKLKGEAAQIGATRLALLAQAIENEARDCVEEKRQPDALATETGMLRACFQQTLQHFDPALETIWPPQVAQDAHAAAPSAIPGGPRAPTVGTIARPAFGRRRTH